MYLALASAFDDQFQAFRASEGLHLAKISIGDTIAAANWVPVSQTSLIALYLFRDKGSTAWAIVSDSNVGSLQARKALELASVTICLPISTADWQVVQCAGNVALLSALASLGNSDSALTEARKAFKFASVTICLSISAADWIVVQCAGNVALWFALSGMSNSNSALTEARKALEFASVTICLSISTADWNVVQGTGNVAFWGLLNAFSRISHGDGALAEARKALHFAFVSVSLSISTTDWHVAGLASNVACNLFLALSSICSSY